MTDDGYRQMWDSWFLRRARGGAENSNATDQAAGQARTEPRAGSGAGEQEFHCEYADVHGFLEPYIRHAVDGAVSARNGAAGALASCGVDVVDIGCGTSCLPERIVEETGADSGLTCALVDISPVALRLNRSVQRGTRRDRRHADLFIGALQLDCRRRMPFPDASVGLVLDKGTMDALHDEGDRRAMACECLRLVRRSREAPGFFVSISFANPKRLALLADACKAVGAPQPRFFVIGRDPCSEVEVAAEDAATKSLQAHKANYFLAVMAGHEDAWTDIGYSAGTGDLDARAADGPIKVDQHEQSRVLLQRILKTGSLLVSEREFQESQDLEDMMGQMQAEMDL